MNKTTPTHTFNDLINIYNLFPDNVLQFTAFKDTTPIATSTVFICNSRVAYTFYISDIRDKKYNKFHAVGYLICRILEWLKFNKYKYIDLGPTTFVYRPHESLIFFKESFGSVGVLKTFYRYDNDKITTI